MLVDSVWYDIAWNMIMPSTITNSYTHSSLYCKKAPAKSEAMALPLPNNVSRPAEDHCEFLELLPRPMTSPYIECAIEWEDSDGVKTRMHVKSAGMTELLAELCAKHTLLVLSEAVF